jgi:hypothetical protein
MSTEISAKCIFAIKGIDFFGGDEKSFDCTSEEQAMQLAHSNLL